MGWMAALRHLSAKLLSDRISSEWEPCMGEVTTIGLDLAKLVFQVQLCHPITASASTLIGHGLPLRVRLGRSAMSAQCPVCPKADSAGRFMSLALAPTPAR